MRIQVLLVDDFPLVREGLASALERDPGLVVVGQASDGDSGFVLARELEPDVAVIDLTMPGSGGIPLIRRLSEELPAIRVLVVSASERAEKVLAAIAAGAAGYITKRATEEELRQAVITIHGGGAAIAPALASHVFRGYSGAVRGDDPGRPLLTPREQEVLRLVADGRTDREIAASLHLSPRTVQNHLSSVRERTGLKRRSELVRWALDHSAI